jgi:hypothetical protein
MSRFIGNPRWTLATGAVALLLALAASLAFALGWGGATASVAQTNTELGQGIGRQEFVGSWRLKSLEVRLSDGQVIYPFGQDAGGVITYNQDGRMSVSVWKANRQPFAINDQAKGTPEENAAAVASYVTYLGTFDVDRSARTVTHHIEQSLFPNWNGTDGVRAYRFTDHGNVLELTAQPFGGQTLVSALVWERMGRGNR